MLVYDTVWYYIDVWYIDFNHKVRQQYSTVVDHRVQQ